MEQFSRIAAHAHRSHRMTRRRLLGEAARLGGAMARANTYASSAPDVYFYPHRKWHGALASVSYTFLKDVVPQIDSRNSIYLMAAGNYPAMMDANVGQGCRLRTICPSW